MKNIRINPKAKDIITKWVIFLSVSDLEVDKMSRATLQVEDLRVYYTSVLGEYKVVDGVDLTVHKDEIFGIAGESGCGKSTLVEGVLRLVIPPGYIKSGRVLFNRVDLLTLEEEALRKIRFKELAYIPQGSMNSLNPVMRVEDQITETIRTHEEASKEEAKGRVTELLNTVDLPPETARMYPHELSGGMQQRVCIAAAMALGPQLIIADEPTTALDVSIQRVVLQSLQDVKEKLKATVVIVCHDMAVHAELADRVAIMYAAKFCEIGDVHTIFEEPLHPYVKALINCIPTLKKRELEGIPGMAPSPLEWPPGCRFHPRCLNAMPKCKRETPKMIEVETGHYVACHLIG